MRVGEFKRVFDPSVGEKAAWYVNDHCFIRDPAGTWHLFGIHHPEPADPQNEKAFVHVSSANLTGGPWVKHAPALEADEQYGEQLLWAPHVIWHNNLYYMFYCAGGPNEAYRIQLATSPDLWHWTRSPDNPLFQDGFHARDPMVLRVNHQWVLYYTATSRPNGGNHIVAYRVSDDLLSWSDRQVAFTDPTEGTWGGPTESPFVVPKGGRYYLFIGPRGGYVGTDVFVSDTPYAWQLGDQVAHIPAHAAEVIQDENGLWYVSRAGWGQGGVDLAPLWWD